MAEDLAPAAPAAAPPAERPLVPTERRHASLYRGRFALAYLVLALLAGAALAAGALLALGDNDRVSGDATWSDWRPTGDASAYPSQIAEFVAPRYRLPSGRQLVAVLAGRPEVQNVEVSAVAIRPHPAAPNQELDVVRTDDAVMYVLCGLGPRCSIAEGKPSVDRHRLLRREALELALYTFKYVDNVSSVIALLPPPPRGGSASALFFRENDRALRPALERPLDRTFSLGRAPLASQIDPAEVDVIEALTAPHVFTYGFQQAQDGSAILVLAPPSQE